MRASRKANFSKEVGLTTYCMKIGSLLEYATVIWEGLPEANVHTVNTGL